MPVAPLWDGRAGREARLVLTHILTELDSASWGPELPAPWGSRKCSEGRQPRSPRVQNVLFSPCLCRRPSQMGHGWVLSLLLPPSGKLTGFHSAPPCHSQALHFQLRWDNPSPGRVWPMCGPGGHRGGAGTG